LFYWLIFSAIRYFDPDFVIPPLIDSDEIYWKLALIVFFFFVWRIINRTFFVYQMYGLLHALLSPIRIVYANIINFFSTVRAIYWFIKSLITGEEPGWLKTEHEFPTEKELQIFRRRVGDIFLENRIITAEQLEKALKEQKKTGKKLGEILLEKGYIVEEDLVNALDIQSKLPSTGVNPYKENE
jgi:adsorption protein B